MIIQTEICEISHLYINDKLMMLFLRLVFLCVNNDMREMSFGYQIHVSLLSLPHVLKIISYNINW